MTDERFELSDFQKWAIKYMIEGQHGRMQRTLAPVRLCPLSL